MPFGGALFTMDVLLGNLTLPVALPALAASLIATGVSWVALPNRATYEIPTYTSSASLVVWAVVFGPIAGYISVLYVNVTAWARGRRFTGWGTVAASLVIFGMLGFAAIPYPQLLGNGTNIVQLAFTNPIDISLIAALLILRLLATAGCLATGAPGGLFTPTITFGALLGGLVGHFWDIVWPSGQDATYAIIGAGAVLAATTLGPVSAIAFLLELTYHIQGLFVPLVVAVAGATIVARAISLRSVYSTEVSAREGTS